MFFTSDLKFIKNQIIQNNFFTTQATSAIDIDIWNDNIFH